MSAPPAAAFTREFSAAGLARRSPRPPAAVEAYERGAVVRQR